ncbi:MAG: hypothetical protein ABR497_12790, partial [Kiritimatiellia bacterium]|nr:hypothetical protein [Lentisphaerota bacterium]
MIMKTGEQRIKLTVIGGGSVNWMQRLMTDVYMADVFAGGEIRLVDPQKEHVEAVADMLRAFNKLRGKDYKIEIFTDRPAALQGTHFVLTTFSPGAMDAFWNDLEIPVKYGIRQPVSMTVGPCGISAALRTVPVAHEIVTEMETACPGAWLLNLTNPMSAVTRAMNLAARQTKVIGLCHEFHCLPRLLGPMLGLHSPENMHVLEYIYRWLPEQGFDYDVAGVNHFIWLTRATLKGEDVLPRIREYCREHHEIPADASKPSTSHAALYGNRHAVKLALCRQFGYLPLAGDRHLIEFHPSLCNIRNGFGMKYNVQKTTVDQRRHAKTIQLGEIRDIAAGRKQLEWKVSGEEMSQLMRAIACGKSIVSIANMPNR